LVGARDSWKKDWVPNLLPLGMYGVGKKRHRLVGDAKQEGSPFGREPRFDQKNTKKREERATGVI